MALKEIESIFRQVFRDDSLRLKNDTTANDIDGWDSITHMRLLNEVEKYFNVDFTYKEVRALKSIGDLVDLVSSKK